LRENLDRGRLGGKSRRRKKVAVVWKMLRRKTLESEEGK
jgi:hypothetical protein